MTSDPKNQDLLINIANTFVKYRFYSCCIPSSILLYELIPNSNLLKGFLNMNNKYSTWHVWVESNGLVFDVGTIITKKYHNIKFDSFLSRDPLYERVDLDSAEEIKTNKQNEMLFDLYQESPNKYWNLLSLVDPKKYNILVDIYNTYTKSEKKHHILKKQDVNATCGCKSNKKYKKCCKTNYDLFLNL